MADFFVTVFQPINPPRGAAAIAATQLRVTVDRGIEWVKQHADEIAQRALGDGLLALPAVPYNALSVNVEAVQ